MNSRALDILSTPLRKKQGGWRKLLLSWNIRLKGLWISKSLLLFTIQRKRVRDLCGICMLYRLNFQTRVPYGVTRSGKPYLMPLVPKLEELQVVEEELEVLEDLESIEVEYSSFPIQNEDTSGCTSFYHSDNDMACIYGATQSICRFSGVVGTIKLEDFIIEFGTWCNGLAQRCWVERSLLWEIMRSLAAVGNDLRVGIQLLFPKPKIIIK